MKTIPVQATLPSAAPASSSGTAGEPLDRDIALAYDTLCAMQVPMGVTRLSEAMAAAGLRTARGTAFTPAELRRSIEHLLAAGLARRDSQSRLFAAAPAAQQRFRELMREPAQARGWFAAWRTLHDFDRGRYGMAFLDDAQVVASMRLLIHGGGSRSDLERLRSLVYDVESIWPHALRQALLQPFDESLFSRVEPAMQAELSEQMLMSLSGVPEAGLAPLEDWLLARIAITPELGSPWLRCRLAETLLFRGDFAGCRSLCAALRGPGVDLLRAALGIAEGHWESGALQFESAVKLIGAELGRRTKLVSPSLGWLYAMALLAQPAPAAWTRARKFAAAESGGKRGADAYGVWAIWLEAIDQRLGDAPKAPARFCLERRDGSGLESLHHAHHLLLAAWLRLQVARPDGLRAHADRVAHDFDQAGMHWPARLVRRAAASLLHEPAAGADAGTPFFVGEAQDSWREALDAILALGPGTAQGAGPALQDRLIWVVDADAEGSLVSLEPMEQKAGVRGLGKPRPVSLATLLKRRDLPAQDAALLRAVEREDFGNRPVLDIAKAVPALVGHPCVAWARDPLRLIEVRESLPALEVMSQGEQVTFRLLDPVRTAGHQRALPEDGPMPQRWRQQRARLRELMLLAEGADRARLVRLTAAQMRVAELVSQGWKVPLSARAELDSALQVLATHFQVSSDADAGHEVPASGLLRAELAPHGEGLSLCLLAAPFGDFGPRLAPGGGRERVTTVHQGVTLSTRRDLAAERTVLQALLDAVDFLDDGVHAWTLDEPERALHAVEALGRLGDGIVTEWPKGKPMRVRPVPDTSVRLRATSKGQWLELDGELRLDDGEVVRLRRLLELAQAGRSRYVALGEGDFLALGEALRQQLGDLAALAQVHKQGHRLSGVAAMAWEAGGHGLVLEGDEAWRRRSQAWERAQEQVFDAPSGLAADLRDYQLEGFRWLMRLGESGFGAVLADDMGLGKTLQTVALLLQRAAAGPALVVAPTSVCGNWLQEMARFAPGLRVELYGDALGAEAIDEEQADAAGPEAPLENARRAARRRQVLALGAGQVLVCSYALLQIDADILAGMHWQCVVLDEAQAIKNAGTLRAKAALALSADFRLALTGTPIENRLAELWSIMGFCNPGLLGSAEQFAQRFANPIERGEDAQTKTQVSRRLRRLIGPFLLRRTKTEVLTDLPPRTEIVHEVVPGAKERALLEALRQQAEHSVAEAMASAAQGGGRPGQDRFHVLAALTRLRRAACDPRLVAPELGIVGAKVQEFERLAQELVAARHKVLVFSQFTDFLGLLRERLDLAGLSYQYLDGSTPAAERNQRVAAFQSGQGELFLISLKAGGFGLNLTVADYVIIADPWWNPAAEEQASARAHRIGQRRPVTVYRLVTQGSIEEKIVHLHRSKRDLADGILSGQDGATPIDAGQLMDLLRAD